MADACGNSYIVLSSPRRLGIHLDRLFKSAKLGRLKLPFGLSEESPCNTVIAIAIIVYLQQSVQDENRSRMTETRLHHATPVGLS